MISTDISFTGDVEYNCGIFLCHTHTQKFSSTWNDVTNFKECPVCKIKKIEKANNITYMSGYKRPGGLDFNIPYTWKYNNNQTMFEKPLSEM